jgi:hypothetical protein
MLILVFLSKSHNFFFLFSRFLIGSHTRRGKNFGWNIDWWDRRWATLWARRGAKFSCLGKNGDIQKVSRTIKLSNCPISNHMHQWRVPLAIELEQWTDEFANKNQVSKSYFAILLFVLDSVQLSKCRRQAAVFHYYLYGAQTYTFGLSRFTCTISSSQLWAREFVSSVFLLLFREELVNGRNSNGNHFIGNISNTLSVCSAAAVQVQCHANNSLLAQNLT